MTRPARTPPAEWLALVAENAERLRRAGVSELELEGCTVRFTPFMEPGRVETPLEESAMDPLDDPRTFPRGVMPAWPRRDA